MHGAGDYFIFKRSRQPACIPADVLNA
jgi:hypothetical protein